MIYKNVELHNVEELKATPDNSGVILRRFPSKVIDALKGRGSFVSRSDTGCEIRFVTSATTIWVTMESMVNNAMLTVYCGDFVYQKIELETGKKTTFQLVYNTDFDKVSKEFFASFPQRFNYNVWRIYINNEGANCIFYDVEGLDGIVRPPQKSELPSLKWLAYGSSITHGWWTGDTSNSYIQHAAKLLNADVMCKGMSGACKCEKEMANYIAAAEWDFATLELGANMLNDFKTKDFKKRQQYMIETVHEAQPDKKVFVITRFPSFNDVCLDADMIQKCKDYEEILIETVNNICSENLILIKGSDVLDSYNYLCYDLVHPSEYGHVRMGENLYKIIKEKL